ncbi:hypothetical protein [Actinoplanes palleronii]|uniref:Uncharacterized protein n=1 Tax=Actinoplanes palleronii TaxID=113570 RepID=A0ABQ4B3Z6_9ACTN|nr:hypothetical protein [Actinoplanes palleronii]GIE65391.1 hypothetical protein Apa02nite_014990 [Actinoplanes palleronii]
MTQLCVITGCRLRDQHLPGCVDEHCGGCLPRTAEEGYVCDTSIARAVSQLALIVDLAPDARAVAAGLVRRGAGGGGGKPGSRPPLNDGATDALDAIQNTLTTLAREIAETRGLQSPSALHGGPGVTDPLAKAASWLSDQMRWLRHALDDQGGPYAVTAFAEIADSAARMRGIVNGPTAQAYLGPCGESTQVETTTYSDTEPTYMDGAPCEGDVYGYRGARLGTCRTCGTTVDQDERRAWLDAQTRDRTYRASEIEHAYKVKAHTIRMWAARGLIHEHDRDLLGRPRYLLGDVLDLAALMAKRRAENEAKRLRRAAEQAAEMTMLDSARQGL